MSEPTINSLDKKIAVIDERLEGIEKTLIRIEDGLNTKAAKWVEKAIVGVVIFVLTAVGTALLALVLK